ncbi:tRNA (adenosine(37)-N6)-threonylcarbamoyltransferase complex ATPase subunit type 1 TsaE [Brachybacterium paraconglomeratum]|uniref:tRNA (adenosine(37)-N6)-threonylcarbamoyltransferase complex ATPase subunit type 1 TsaE n=1 Tax=Brachybacterium paraconglomeratum TaxID=173362 RepID=UPI003A4E0AF2
MSALDGTGADALGVNGPGAPGGARGTAGEADGALVLRTRDADGTRALARALSGALRAGDLLVLDGPLGAGKTTFTQGLGAGLGVRGPVASPTFVIERVHPNLAEGPDLVHVDAYRLGGEGEIDDLDLEADLDRAVTVVEWGRDRVEHLADSVLLVELERPDRVDDPLDPDEPRTLRLTPRGPRWDGAAIAALEAALAAVAGPDGTAEPADAAAARDASASEAATTTADGPARGRPTTDTAEGER